MSDSFTGGTRLIEAVDLGGMPAIVTLVIEATDLGGMPAKFHSIAPKKNCHEYHPVLQI